MLDPPYHKLDNSFYNAKMNSDDDIYDYLNQNKIEKENARIYLILQLNPYISSLFNHYKIYEYNKTYQTTKKHNIHCIYYNKKNN